MQETKGVVSVVIPVYNAGATLRACLDSVLGQTYRELEVLAVDDGSTDDSLAILEAYGRKDARMRVFSVPNGGAARARNYCIDRATGEYLQFVDSDDLLPPDATARMLAAMTDGGADMVIAPFVERMGRRRRVRGFMREDRLLSQRAFLDALCKHPNSFYFAVLWNKLYRRALVEGGDVRCDAELPWGEDFVFNTLYYRHARSVATLQAPVYEYRRSLTGLASGSAWLFFKRPLYSVRIRISLWRRYEALYRAVGLYDQYGWRLKLYLFKFTINN